MDSVGATPQHKPLLAADLVGLCCLLVGALAHSTEPSAGRPCPLSFCAAFEPCLHQLSVLCMPLVVCFLSSLLKQMPLPSTFPRAP